MSEPHQSLRVFISYARSDGAAFAEELLAGLEAAGFDPFLDRHDIAAGEDWEARLGNLLQQADTVVYVLSPASVGSERCAWEIDRANELAKRVIPVVALDVNEADTPEKLRRLNYIFFSPGHSFGAALRQLSGALRTDLTWVREHTRIGELASRWRDRGKPEALLLRASELEAAKTWLLAWKAGAPEVTELHRLYLNESDSAELARTSEERRKLDEITAAQAEKTHALKRIGRLYAAIITLSGLMFIAACIGGVVVFLQDQRLKEKDAQIDAFSRNTVAQAEVTAADDLRVKSEVEALKENADTTPAAPAQLQRPSATIPDAARQASTPAGWNIDVFWCEGGDGAQNRQKADSIETLLKATKAAPAGANDLFAVGSIRVRPLTERINAFPGYQVNTDVVRAERGEAAQAQQLQKFLTARQGPTLGMRASTISTPSYLSVFLCAPAQ